MINYYKCITSSSQVLGSISVENYLNKIQYGDNNLNKILEAREIYYENALKYSAIKRNHLNCYTLNFTFNQIRRDTNIIDSTGYMYLDIDGNTEIDFNHPLLHASWLSLSGKGRGAIVKVKGVNNDNFNYNYTLLSEELNIKSDIGARKKSQLNVLSYDPNIYVNKGSDYWICESNNIKYPHYSGNIKNKPLITTVMGEKPSFELRFDNLDYCLPQVDFDGDAIYDLKHKIPYSKVKLPFNKIEDGSRNSILSSIAYQIRALNPYIDSNFLMRLVVNINHKICINPIPQHEIKQIVNSIMKIEDDNLKPILNTSRRFVYNEIYDLSVREKRSITMTAINSDKIKKSRLTIEKAIDDWDFEIGGKITQNSLTNATGMNKKTIEKYYPDYKSDIKLLNEKYYKK